MTLRETHKPSVRPHPRADRIRAATSAASPLAIWIALGAVYVVWGSTYLAIRVADETLPPFLMAATRFLVAGGLLYLWAVRRGDTETDRPTWRQWRSAFVVGTLLLLGGNGGVVWAEQHVASGTVALLVAAVPIWMVIVGRVGYGERISLRAVIGLGVGFGGLALLVGNSVRDSAGGHTSLFAVVVVLLASLSWAAGSLHSRYAPLPKRALVTVGMEMVAGSVSLAIFSALSGELAHLHPSRFSLPSILGLGYLIVFGSWIGFVAYIWLLRVAPTSLVGTYAYVNPVVAVFLGWLLLDETITARTLLAAAVIVMGVALVVSAKRVVPGDPADAAPAVATPPARRAAEDARRTPGPAPARTPLGAPSPRPGAAP